jgi:predicted deacylase
MIAAFYFNGEAVGKTLLVLGAIHGNETCGPNAINKLISQLQSKEIKLISGRLILVPVCNKLAYQQNVRQMDENLNRVIRKWDNPDSYEKLVANELLPLFDSADYVVDLHSMPSGDIPFAFADNSHLVEFAGATGAEYIMTGWNDLFDDSQDSSTGGYAASIGKVATTVECGQDGTIESDTAAHNIIMNILRYLKMIDGVRLVKKQIFLKMIKLVNYQGGKFVNRWKNFDRLYRGDVIAIDREGNDIISDKDCVIVMPNTDPDINLGEWWYYLGEFDNN